MTAVIVGFLLALSFGDVFLGEFIGFRETFLEGFDKGIIEDEKELERIFAQKKYKKRK